MKTAILTIDILHDSLSFATCNDGQIFIGSVEWLRSTLLTQNYVIAETLRASSKQLGANADAMC